MTDSSCKQLLLVLLLTCVFSSPTISASPTSEEEPERIVVYRERTLSIVKKEMRGLTKSFYRLFNQLNDEKKFDVVCQRQTIPNRLLRTDVCEPRYVKDIRSQFIKTHGLTGINFEREINITAKKEREIAKEHMIELIQSHPELRKEFLRLNSLVLEWKQLKESKG
jgi:hypothetical protein